MDIHSIIKPHCATNGKTREGHPQSFQLLPLWSVTAKEVRLPVLEKQNFLLIHTGQNEADVLTDSHLNLTLRK